MSKSYYCLLLCIFFWACEKETPNIPSFEKTFGSSEQDFASEAISIDQDIFILGTTCCVNNNKALYLLKADANGTAVFEKKYQLGQNCSGMNITQGSDGHLFLVGIAELPLSSSSGTQVDIYLLKVDKEGRLIWETTIGTNNTFDLAEGIVACSDGGLMLLTAVSNSATSFRDIKLIRLDSNGSVLWEKEYPSNFDDNGINILPAGDGNYLLLGRRRDGDDDFLLMKVDALGNELWTKTYGGAGYEEAHSIKKTKDNNFILCGHSASVDPLHNLYILKVDANGTIIWENNYGGAVHDGGTDAVELESGNFVLVGETDSYGNGSKRLLEIKIDKNGTLIDIQSHGGDLDDKATAVVATPEAYFMIGQSASFSSDGNSDVFVVKRPIF